MRKSTIQTRLFFAFFALAALIVCVLSVIFYRYTSELLTSRELEAFRETAGVLRESTDSALKTLDNVSIDIGFSSLVRDRLNSYFSAEEPTQAQFTELAELFVSINGSEYPSCQIFLYNNEGKSIGVGLVNRTGSVDLKGLSWVAPTAALKGKKFVSAPYSTSFYSRSTVVSPWYVSLYRTYFDRFGNQTGYLEVVQSYKTIFKSALSYSKRSRDVQIYIFNEFGAPIFPAGQYDAALSHYYELASDQTLSDSPQSSAEELVAVERSDYSGWTYVYTRPKSAVLSPVREAGLLLFCVLAVFIPLIVALSYFAARRITLPIKRLVTALRETRIETLGEAALTEPTHVNELDELNEAFDRMSADLKTSMNELLETRAQEQKSRTLALQSQINPHFYYNSLSSIMILAENGQTDDVVKMCRNLSGIMRYITDSSSMTVTLAEELDYVEKYLYCMKVRYQSSLVYSIDVDEALKTQSVPRLIIQPLVENALKYGSNCAPPWKIRVFSTKRENYWTISVRDSGPGFSKEAIKLTHERVKESERNTGLPPQHINGMGLINVYSRWRLFAGKAMLFEFANSSENGGAIVSIGLITKKEGRA